MQSDKSKKAKTEWAPREIVGFLLCLGIMLFLAYYVIVIVIFIINCSEAAHQDISIFWDSIEWTGWGLLIGFIISQLVVLVGVLIKVSCYSGGNLSNCQRLAETVLVDLRTSMIYNDYRALKQRFK